MMKHQGSSYCCRWFTLLLVAVTCIVLVSSDIHTTFAGSNNYKQKATKAEGSTAAEATKAITQKTEVTTMSAMRTIQMLEAMGFIDTNRYNNSNNSHTNTYNISMSVVNSSSTSTSNNKKHNNSSRSAIKSMNNKIYSAKSNTLSLEDVWNEHLEEVDHIKQLKLRKMREHQKLLEQSVATECAEHMVSIGAPQSMTIIVEKPTMMKPTETTTTIPTRTTQTIIPSSAEIASSKPTTAITMATKAIRTTHSDDGAIKMSPGSEANTNVKAIKENDDNTMIYKQMQRKQQQQQQLQTNVQKLEQEQEEEQQQQQLTHTLKMRIQQQQETPYWQRYKIQQQQPQQPSKTEILPSIRKKWHKSQTYIGNNLLDSQAATESAKLTTTMYADERLGEESAMNTRLQKQIVIKSNINNNSNGRNKNKKVTTTTTTTTTTIATTNTAPPTTITTVPIVTTKSATNGPQFEAISHILYYNNIDDNDENNNIHNNNNNNNKNNNNESDLAMETDVQIVVATAASAAAEADVDVDVDVDVEVVEDVAAMEANRHYQHKFSSFSSTKPNAPSFRTTSRSQLPSMSSTPPHSLSTIRFSSFNTSNLDDNHVVHNYAPTTTTLLHWVSSMPRRIPYNRNRWKRQAGGDDDEEPVDKCRQFIEGEGEKNVFYSPDYPNDYPKNINCTRKIIAPPGQIIRLDFRNSFHIEAKEDCKFDFLEIRDGQYGFSPLIGKFCGTDFPPEITSKERYLWLHFHSDESIEYSGFTAVYEFIDRSKEAPTTDLNCTIEKDGFEGFVNSSEVPYDIRDTVIKTKIPLDCIWRIQVQDNWKIQVKFLDFKLSKPNDCDTNFLDIFPEKTVMPLRLKNFCGSAGEGITSESNVLNLRFFAEPAAINSTFAILYTAFRDRGAGCTEEEHDCQDATCIAAELKCNQRDNCKFRWDEEDCDKEKAKQSEHMIIIMIVFGLILGGMIITFLVNCVRKIMHDQKIIREHIRQSKESKLDELGRSSKARSRDNLSSTMPRVKHSQTSLHILDDTSNRYYREVVPMSSSHTNSKVDLKEREHSILRQRNDMIVQTSFCSGGDDNSSEATMEAQQQAASTNACDMGCQTRESLFATPSLMHQSSMGSLKDKTSLHSRSRFSTFGYDTPNQQPTPPPLPISSGGGRSQLPGLNIRDAQGYIEMRERHPGPKPSMPHMHRMNALPPTPPTASILPEMCHHHHQHAQHTHVHTQQQQQQHHQPSLGMQQQLSTLQKQSKENAATTTHGGGGGRSTATTGTTATSATTPAQGVVGSKGKPKLSQSTAYIDIRNSAPDVIIMTSH